MLLERYLAKYPDDADKIVLNIKDGLKPETHQVDTSSENTRRSLNNCIAQLKCPKQKIDIFEFNHRDPAVPMDVAFDLIDRNCAV